MRPTIPGIYPADDRWDHAKLPRNPALCNASSKHELDPPNLCDVQLLTGAVTGDFVSDVLGVGTCVEVGFLNAVTDVAGVKDLRAAIGRTPFVEDDTMDADLATEIDASVAFSIFPQATQ
jgi:hypothetical protein